MTSWNVPQLHLLPGCMHAACVHQALAHPPHDVGRLFLLIPILSNFFLALGS